MNMAQIREAIKADYGVGQIQIRQPGNSDEREIGGAQVYARTFYNKWIWLGSFKRICEALKIATVRDDVETITYHRAPTVSELRFGEGATHYRDFSVEDCCYKGTRIAKRWLVASDGLRYYR